jgi:hypothetical protein
LIEKIIVLIITTTIIIIIIVTIIVTIIIIIIIITTAVLFTSPDLNAVASSALLFLFEFASEEPTTPNEGKE